MFYKQLYMKIRNYVNTNYIELFIPNKKFESATNYSCIIYLMGSLSWGGVS